jgi:hypothetical protein
MTIATSLQMTFEEAITAGLTASEMTSATLLDHGTTSESLSQLVTTSEGRPVLVMSIEDLQVPETATITEACLMTGMLLECGMTFEVPGRAVHVTGVTSVAQVSVRIASWTAPPSTRRTTRRR